MHKKIVLSLICISSFSLAVSFGSEKDELLKKLAALKVQEKHLDEKEKAIGDLKKALYATQLFIASGAISPSIMQLKLLPSALTDPKIQCLGNIPVIVLVWISTEIGLAGYALYKTCQGTKHLILPDHPKSKETTDKK